MPHRDHPGDGLTTTTVIPAFTRDVYLKQVVERCLDIHLGVRIYNRGEGINRVTLFLPITAGDAAMDRIYYNLEHIIHQNLVAYDELHDHYLPVSAELIGRELETTIVRAREKENTRKKIINGLKFHTVLMEDPSQINHISLADLYYDKLNRIDLLPIARGMTNFLFYMLRDDGLWYNFMWADGKINESHQNSRAEFGWWAARALLRLAAAEVMIPTGLTRHLIPGRALGINLDLALVTGPESPAEKEAFFQAFVDRLSMEGHIRFYEESVFIMNE